MPSHTKPTALTLYFLWLLSLCEKSKRDTDYFLEILMIKESYNLTGWKHILVNSLKVYVIHEENLLLFL